MRIKYRYAFELDNDTRDIVDLLGFRKIEYRARDRALIAVLEIYEDNEYWSEINELMEKHSCIPIIECIYTKQELKEAEWLTIRSTWRNEYPQPDDDYAYMSITYDNSNFCSSCGSGLIQKDNFRLRMAPQWGKSNFYSINWVYDELFVTDLVKEEIVKNKLQGISFRPVIKHKTGEILQNINQIYVENTLSNNLIIKPEEIEEEIYCPKCKEKKYIVSGKLIPRLNKEDIDNSLDIIKTKDKFGDGLMCSSKVIISHRMYKVLNDNGFDKNLFFVPIEML